MSREFGDESPRRFGQMRDTVGLVMDLVLAGFGPTDPTPQESATDQGEDVTDRGLSDRPGPPDRPDSSAAECPGGLDGPRSDREVRVLRERSLGDIDGLQAAWAFCRG